MEQQKKDFIWKKGVLGVGLPVGVLMAVTTAFQVPGYIFQLQGFQWKTFFLALIIFVPLFSAAGYVWGIFVYKYKRKK